MSEYAMTIRKLFGEGDAKRNAGMTTPDNVTRYDDISYGEEEPKWQKLDVYRPKGVEGKLPVILNVHGGGWVYGDKEVYQYYCMSLAQRGFAVVNCSYRLAPEYKYPSSFEDISTVSTWIIEHQEEYGFDVDHIFGVGDSAGGHMLSLYACALTNPAYKADFTLPKNFMFKAIALNCGAYHLSNEEGKKEQLMEEFMPKGGTDEELAHISSYQYVTEAFPPTFIMTCPGDFLKEAPTEMVSSLKEQGVPFIYRYYGSKANPLTHVFHCNIVLPEATLCNDEECNFFKTFCM